LTKRLVEIDDDELRLAREARGFTTIKETVSAGLRELAAVDARRREIERMTTGSLTEFADKQTRLDAWR